MAFIFDHAHRCTKGAEGEWAAGPSPPPCGQLTRCFSAVAELLVGALKILDSWGPIAPSALPVGLGYASYVALLSIVIP